MNRREIITTLPLALIATTAAAEPSSAPRPLTERGLANLQAFARLAAYVRFFHPSDEAAATDWNSFVVSNIEAIEAAPSKPALVQRLDAAFRPIAPTLALFATAKPPAGAETPPLSTPGTLVMWKHHGVGLTTPSIYRSERTAVADGQAKVLRLDLGGEISAVMPITAYSASLSAQPASPAPLTAFSGDDRKVRLADVLIAWGVLQHFYPYFDVVNCDWNAELPKALRAAAVDPDGRQFRVTLARMLAALHDGHGNVYDRRQLTILPVGWSWIEDQLVITALPADAAPGLAIGGVVRRIDGVDVRQRLAELDPEVCAATPQWLRFKSLQLLQRHEGTSAALEGEGPDGQPFKVQLAPVSPQLTRDLNPRTTRANFSEPRPGVVYVDLMRVTDEDVASRMDQLAAAKAIVLDDRGYPTGAARKLLFHFSDRTLHSARFEMPIITAPDRRDVAFDADGSWVMPPQAPRLGARLVLLTGGGSISYAESWAGVFEGERLGPIVGGPTAGTNGNINRLPLPGGYSLLFTGMRVRKPDGSRHHGVGIIPTVPVEQTLAGVRAGRDEVLERGVAVALGEA